MCICNSVANILKNEQIAKGNKIREEREEMVNGKW